MLDPNANRELMTRYIMEKFIPALEKDLIFRKLAPPVSPFPRRTRIKHAVQNYFGHLWLALRGKRCYERCCGDGY